MTTSSLRILVVDDDSFVLESLGDFLSSKNMIVTKANSFSSALEHLKNPNIEFDVALIDIVLPEISGGNQEFSQNYGIEIARSARQRFPELGLVFMSSYRDLGPEVLQFFKEGHDCIVFLFKPSPPAKMLESIHKVSKKQTAIEIDYRIKTRRKSFLDSVLDRFPPEARRVVLRAFENVKSLTDTEEKVFLLLGYSYSSQHISQLLKVQSRAIDAHRGNIYEKLYLRQDVGDFNQLSLITTISLLYQLQDLSKSNDQ